MLAIGLSALFGLGGAYSIASEPIAYIASMFYGIFFLYLLIPTVLILFVSGIVAASLGKGRYAAALFLGCALLPFFFIGGFQAMRALGWAVYETNGSNEMRPIDEEPNGSIIVVYQMDSSFEEQQEMSNQIIHPWEEGPGFTGETGVRSSMGLGKIDGRVAQKIFFAASATESKKEKLRMGLQASPIVYRYFENTSVDEVRSRLERRKTFPPEKYPNAN